MALSTRKSDLLHFLADPRVPFTNNLAERDGEITPEGLRRLPLRASAADFAVIRSLLSTARKQGWGLLQTLTGDPTQLIANLRSA